MQKGILQKDEPLLCTLHSNDANHQAANLVNWQQEFDQLSQGQFAGMINELHFPHIHLFQENTSHSLRQQCRVEEGGLWLGLSANAKSCRINHQQSNHEQFLCRPGSRDFELLTPDNFSIYGLVLHPSFFTELIETEQHKLFDNKSDKLWLENINQDELNTFKQYLTLLLNPQGQRWSLSTHQHILQDAVVELLSKTQQTSSSTYISSAQRNRIVTRVEEYLTETRLKQPITITELCKAVHVSRRTLQYTFEQCYGISPKQYIQVLRLNQVRRSLSANQEQQTIADIALKHGFFHLGQFSQSYKRLFGETPMQTRMQTKLRVG